MQDDIMISIVIHRYTTLMQGDAVYQQQLAERGQASPSGSQQGRSALLKHCIVCEALKSFATEDMALKGEVCTNPSHTLRLA
jgi:hypothetical protein